MSAGGRLWIIDPSTRYPEEEGVAEILRGWGGSHRLFRPSLRDGDGPAPAAGYETDGIVIMGSAASVHDRLPWIADLAAWLAPVVRGEVRVPVLGLCFGHQLIAHLTGGRVGYVREDRSKIVGVSSSIIDGSRLVPDRRSLRVVVSHREEVKQAPAGFHVVARRDACTIDGLEHETLPLFSFQFHPEARVAFAQHCGFDPALVDAQLRQDCELLLGGFCDWVEKSRTEKKPADHPPAQARRR